MTQFCDNLYDQEFATKRESNYTCPMQVFDGWLQQQSQSDNPDEIYTENCSGASGIPVPQEDFHSCIVAWTEQVGETSILSRNGQVQIIFVPFASRVRYDNHYDQLDTEWKMIEKWMDDQNRIAPQGVENAYFTSFDFWWYDVSPCLYLLLMWRHESYELRFLTTKSTVSIYDLLCFSDKWGNA